MISKEELLQKMLNAVPGKESPPDKPPYPYEVKKDCEHCLGTGWKYSERYERYFICDCVVKHKPDFEQRLPYRD